MNNQFDEPRERSRSLASWGQPAPLSRGELTKSMAQSVTRRAALKRFGVGLAGMALACFGLANKAEARGGKCLPSGTVCRTYNKCKLCCSGVCAGGGFFGFWCY